MDDWTTKILDAQFNDKAPLSQPQIVTDFLNRALNQGISAEESLEAVTSITKFAQKQFPDTDDKLSAIQNGFNAYLDLRNNGSNHTESIMALTGLVPDKSLNNPFRPEVFDA